MKRLLWLGIGLAVGALVVRAVTKKAQSYTPRGIAAAVRDSGRNTIDSVRDFVDDVRDSMHEREDELFAALAEGHTLAELGLDEDLAGEGFDGEDVGSADFGSGDLDGERLDSEGRDRAERAFDAIDAAEGNNR